MLENVLAGIREKPEEQKTWKGFIGFLTEDEATEWIKDIEEGYEQVNSDGWKQMFVRHQHYCLSIQGKQCRQAAIGFN